ncbi:hypothetical protein E1193_04190 [Micromonospora sp. KC606]|uniref:hypothetical protein n=1 Tax=Micromonospora sp. KC606 TaxID=2530379 RepID=UPI00104998EB|nr:hypothetical protein [Micromonospora sp. KC606]TDC84968.1 hypothetical protein E1193_04190 [Micromonospora sp. KC606]
MTVITTSPRTTGAHPATVVGGFSHSWHPVAGAPRFRSLTPAAACGCMAQFLAPSIAEEEKPAPRASDCGEVAMHRLRHPFAVAADTTPQRTTVKTAAQIV